MGKIKKIISLSSFLDMSCHPTPIGAPFLVVDDHRTNYNKLKNKYK